MIGEHIFVIIIRVLVTLVLAGLIGFEREIKNHSAGFRTHILVGIGSCLMMLLSLYGFETILDKYEAAGNIRFDPARIPSYVISGIGFLGAGTIIVYGGTVRGLTTAATIWTVAGVGLIVGSGMYATAVFATIVILLSLSILNKVEKQYISRRTSNIIKIVASPEIKINAIVARLESLKIEIKNIELINTKTGLKKICIEIEQDIDLEHSNVLADISNTEHVKSVSD